MNKKIILVSIFAVLMFATMSVVSAINSTTVSTEEKESPLYKFRAERAYTPQGKLREVRNTLISRFLGENRIFFVQEPSADDLLVRDMFADKAFTNRITSPLCCYATLGRCTDNIFTCRPPHGCGL